MFESNYVDNEDHPHAYGDKIDDATYLMVNEGSSPRVWDKKEIGKWRYSL